MRVEGVSITTQSTSGNLTVAASARLQPLPQEIRLAAGEASVFESRAALVLVVNPRGFLLYASPAWERIFDKSPEAAVGQPILQAIPGERLHEEHARSLMNGLRAALLDGAPHPIPLHYRDSGRGWHALEGRTYGTDDANRIIAFHDVTERFDDLARLMESESRLRRVGEASRDIVIENDLDGHFTYVSNAVEDVLGYLPEELIKTPLQSLQHPNDIDRFRREIRERGGSYEPFEVTPFRFSHKQGHWVWLEAAGVRYRATDGQERTVGVAWDITERIEGENQRREMEERMLRSQKLESLGVLAGGIAHDFNNLLTPIVGNAGLLLTDLPEDSPARRWAAAIQTAGHRATKLTTQMLAYAGQQGRQLRAMDVSAVIDDVSLLLETTASSASRVHYELARDLPPVHGDTGQITQVVMNLVANASDAMGPDGGRIDIRTEVLDASREFLDGCYLGESRQDGAFVVLEVIDDGPGLDPELREQIFDPFFTTKFTGRGLGLAVVLGAVQAHGGALQIESEPGHGACFRILLPSLRGDTPHSGQLPFEDDTRFEAGSLGRETLLVVDDDDGARELTTTLLSRAGFDVLQATNGPDAIDLYRDRKEDIAGVLLDGTMPGMSGAHVFDALRQLDPAVRVVLVSGYTQDEAADPLFRSHLSGFLHKPYGSDELLRVVWRLLEPL